MKDLKIVLSSFLIILSFFIWYIYSSLKYQDELSKIRDEKYYINLSIKDNKIDFLNENKNVFILVNWEEIDSASLEF